MDRRRFIIGLGAATAGGSALPGSGAATGKGQGHGKGNKSPRGRSSEPPIENVHTGETYDSISSAIEEASRGETLGVALGTRFDEDVTVDTEELTLEAKTDTRLHLDSETDIETYSAEGNDEPTIESDADVVVLTAKGNAKPRIVGGFDHLLLETRGKAAPTVDGDVDRLFLDARGNSTPRITGDVGYLLYETRGRANLEIHGDIDEKAQGEIESQPAIDGNVEIEANGVTLEGFDITAETVGIDVLADDPTTVRVSNNSISGASGAVDEGLFPPESGIGVRITTSQTSEPITVGGETKPNVLSDNDVGFVVVDSNGDVADVDTMSLLTNNFFIGNKVAVLPDPGDPKDELDPIVSTEPPIEILTSERRPGETITAPFPDVTIDESESTEILSLSVRPESETAIEITFDPDQPMDDPDLVEGYDAIDGGAFRIDTPLAETEIEAVRFTFAVERDAIDDPDQFTVHRRVDGTFEPLRTELVSETPTSYQFTAFAPGFSIFQLTEFNVGGIGGAGRALEGEIRLPAADPIPETFLRLETTENIDQFEFEAGNEPADGSVSIDDSITIDLEEYPEEDLPSVFFDIFRVTNTGDEPATISTNAGLNRATILNVPIDVDLSNIVDSILSPTVVGDFVEVLSNPIELAPGETTSIGLSLAPTAPDNQLWVTLGVPTLVHESSGEAYLGSEATAALERIDHDCVNDADAPVISHREYGYGEDGSGLFSSTDWIPDGADDDTRFFRVPAYLNVNWHSDALRSDERIAVRVEMNDGPEGSLVGIYDKNGLIGDEGTLYTNPIALFYSGSDFADGAVAAEFDLIFDSDSNCESDSWFQTASVDSFYDNVGDLEFTVLFHGSDNRWAEETGEEEVSAAATFYTMGETTEEITNELMEEAFQTFAEGVLSAAMPSFVQTYRVARAAMTAGRSTGAGLELAAFWNGLDSIDRNRALTPQTLLASTLAEGITGFSGSRETELPPPLETRNLDVGIYGPSIYVSDEPKPSCIEPRVRTLSVEGQVAGGPVVLMGLDSEEGAGRGNHGPPEEHAAMVASILDNVTNSGDGILVLGGDPDRNSNIETYWADDIAADPRVNETVTFVNGADEIRDVDFEEYAMIGVVSSDGEIWNGLTESENEALVDRRGAIAAFINDGGGLLGKTQDGLSDPWKYISSIVDIESVHASNSSIEVTDAGKELGLTQNGMDGWCCYHESFEEESIPDFLDVLLRNPERSGNPPAAIGGDEVVVQTAVELEVTGPANVESGEPIDFDIALANAADEAGEDVRLEIEFTRDDGIEAGDVELRNGGTLTLEDDALVGTLTEAPIEFAADLDEEFSRSFVFDTPSAKYDAQIEVVSDETDEPIVRLPFGIRTVAEPLDVCDD